MVTQCPLCVYVLYLITMWRHSSRVLCFPWVRPSKAQGWNHPWRVMLRRQVTGWLAYSIVRLGYVCYSWPLRSHSCFKHTNSRRVLQSLSLSPSISRTQQIFNQPHPLMPAERTICWSWSCKIKVSSNFADPWWWNWLFIAASKRHYIIKCIIFMSADRSDRTWVLFHLCPQVNILELFLSRSMLAEASWW